MMTHIRGDWLNRLIEEIVKIGDGVIKKTKNECIATTDIIQDDTVLKFKSIALDTNVGDLNCEIIFVILYKIVSSFGIPSIDIVLDFATAYLHFKFGDYNWCFLTILFVYLPGFIFSVSVFIVAFFKSDCSSRITAGRLIRLTLMLLLFPFLYPIVNILLGLLMIVLTIKRRDKEAITFMDHDLKQFRSLAGFLESPPQFVLQSYIILRGHNKGDYAIDWDDIRGDNAERLAILCFCIFFSLLSLIKTSCDVNVPDPDQRRKEPHYIRNSKLFTITLLLYNVPCILFRIVSITIFFTYMGGWTVFLIVYAFIANIITLYFTGVSPTILLVLGSTIVVPNGYLLYNFSGMCVVDIIRKEIKLFLICHTVAINLIFMIGVIAVAVLAEFSLLPDDYVFKDLKEQKAFLKNILIALTGLCCASWITGIIHWKLSISKIFIESSRHEAVDQEYTKPETQELLQMEKQTFKTDMQR